MTEVDIALETTSIVAELGFEAEIARLRTAIDTWIDGTSDELQETLRWQFSGTSKYYRPLTVFSCYRAVCGPQIPQSVIHAAVGIELFHNMSLIIDDILDRSPQRRGKDTLHCRFGELPALMAAGYIVADGYETVIDDRYSIGLLSELMKRLGAAECLQWRLRRTPLGVEDWRTIAGEDTGSMFEVAACLGARSESMRQYGHLLGVLYHGCDDVADVRGLTALGGGGSEDIRDGILTLPAALAIRNPGVADIFVKGDDDAALLAAFEAELPAAEAYLDEIQDQAKKEAALFSESPEGLINLVDKVRKLSET